MSSRVQDQEPLRGLRRRIATGAAVVAALLTAAAPASSEAENATEFGLSSFTTSVVNAAGEDETQASAHPFSATASFTVNTRQATGEKAMFGQIPVEEVKTIVTDLPPGFVGNPRATSVRCTVAELNRSACPLESQVGRAELRYLGLTAGIDVVNAIHNMVPSPGKPAEFAFKASQLGIVTLIPELRRESDYGLRVTVPYAQQADMIAATITLWGVPADPAHDPERIRCLFGGFGCSGGHPSADRRKPFLTNPSTGCTDTQPLTRLSVDSWNRPGAFKEYVAASPRITGCEKLTFEPSADVAPTVRLPDAPTGLKVRMSFPTEDNAAALAPPALKKAVVTLPEGMTITPSGAGGLAACADGELLLRSKDPMTCPDASKIGEVRAVSPLLEEPVEGGVYIRSQNSADPESGEMFRLALVLQNEERGIDIRLPGQVRADRVTGRITTTFDDNPELPLSRIDLTFKDGPRAPLATPATCGAKTTDVVLTSWGGQTERLQSHFELPCTAGLGGFAPSFSAGVVNPSAGAYSAFVATIARRDGEQELRTVERVALPEGLLAAIGDVPLCSEAQAAAGSCDQASNVGHVQAAAGAGPAPLWVPQAGKRPSSVSLTGPYKGAPYGLSIVVPAQAGPFDLGTIVVRSALHVDPRDAHVTAVTDQLPTVFGGVPLRLREIRLVMDRQRFMVNPTGCSPKRVGVRLGSAANALVDLSSRFQVGDCARLPIQPRMVLTAGGTGKTGVDRRTPFTARLTMPRGQGNLRQVDVVLPKTLNGRLDVIQRDRACTMAQFEADRCPNAIGQGVATTPLLRDPLRGRAYFLYNPDRKLPDIVVRLRGPVDVDLVGKVTIPRSLTLRTSFDTVPDVPVDSFTLTLNGGERDGPIGVVKNLCTREGRSGKARIAFVGHNRKRVDVQQTLRIKGCRGVRPQARRAVRRQARKDRARGGGARRASLGTVAARTAR